MMREFWAHSDPIQLLASHLSNVAVVAECLAKSAAPEEAALHTMAHLAGLLHDYGKYTECFQQRIRGAAGRCPHSIQGAIAVRQFGLRPGSPLRHWAMPVVHAIAAHHGGLRNHADLDLLTRPSNPSPEPKQMREEATKIWKTALTDQPAIRTALLAEAPGRAGGTRDLLTRILLSCLVDADRLDSAGRQPTQAPLKAEERLSQLMLHLNNLQADAPSRGGNATVLEVRQQVQQLCHDAAQGDARLLSLAVPTGGGKTLAAMRFALERAAAHPDDYRRIIVVIPYLSIIEQNAEVYRKVFGYDAIFEHHSGAVYALRPHGDKFTPRAESDEDPTLPLKRLETENWDAPVIVTTSVRFFESLFSNHPSDLRRVHNIARSIIVLDEVQTLPRRLLAPLLDMLRELTEDWGCTVVMATATQPAFEVNAASARKTHERYAWPAGTVTPIIPPAISAEMHTSLRRVQIEWRIERALPWPSLAAEMLTHPQALCVVNLRAHAAKVYDELLAQSDEQQHEGIFHLSTRMCAQHRLDVLAVIRERLAAGKVCRVVSTQLIEAGVDVDFPIAFRALGPLDAIIQVAGRVDREGRLTAAAGKPAGRLVVFATEDGKTPPYEYKEATAVTEALARESDLQTDDLAAMQSYFERYYGDADDQTRGKPLAEMRGDDVLAFKKLADEFEMINSRTKDVFVAYDKPGGSREGTKLIDELQSSFVLNGSLLRRLQRYSVGLQPWDFDDACRKGLIMPHPHIEGIWTASTTAYDVGRGLREEHMPSALIG
jgi:CRISPR-associated endonuclease/helicase Cas3